MEWSLPIQGRSEPDPDLVLDLAGDHDGCERVQNFAAIVAQPRSALVDDANHVVASNSAASNTSMFASWSGGIR